VEENRLCLRKKHGLENTNKKINASKEVGKKVTRREKAENRALAFCYTLKSSLKFMSNFKKRVSNLNFSRKDPSLN